MLLKIRFIGIALLMTCRSAGAQWIEKNVSPDEYARCSYSCASSQATSFSGASATQSLSHDYDVLRYRLSLQLSMTGKRLQGVNQIRFRSNVATLSRRAVVYNRLRFALCKAAFVLPIERGQ